MYEPGAGTGTITVRSQILLEIYHDVARSLIHHGFSRLVFVNNHGSNVKIIDPLLRRIRYETGAFVAFSKLYAERYLGLISEVMENPPEETPGWHSSELETAQVLAHDEELVRMDRAVNQQVKKPDWFPDSFIKLDGAPEVEFQGYQYFLFPTDHSTSRRAALSATRSGRRPRRARGRTSSTPSTSRPPWRSSRRSPSRCTRGNGGTERDRGAMNDELGIALIGTLDTKADEIAYVRDKLVSLGANPIVIDSGILGEPGIAADVPREEVAGGAGYRLEDVQEGKPRRRGRPHDRRRTGGLPAALAGGAHQRSPVPRRRRGRSARCGGHARPSRRRAQGIVSPSASGRRAFGPFVGESDVLVMHSVIDILGLNPISRSVFDNAAAAVAGMARDAGRPVSDLGGRSVGITMLGHTTPAVMRIKVALERAGHEPVIFHANGVGGPAMEKLVSASAHGRDRLHALRGRQRDAGGLHATGPERLTVAGKHGLPQVIVPGCVDFFNQGARETVPEEYRGRKSYYHNPVATLVRLEREEMAELGRIVAARLNDSRGPVRVVAPSRGFSMADVEGGDLWDADADGAFLEALGSGLRPEIPFELVETHVNDPDFADLVAERYLALVPSRRPPDDARRPPQRKSSSASSATAGPRSESSPAITASRPSLCTATSRASLAMGSSSASTEVPGRPGRSDPHPGAHGLDEAAASRPGAEAGDRGHRRSVHRGRRDDLRRLVHDLPRSCSSPEPESPRALTLVTNSPAIAMELDAPAIHVVLAPGEVDQTLRMIGGRWAAVSRGAEHGGGFHLGRWGDLGARLDDDSTGAFGHAPCRTQLFGKGNRPDRLIEIRALCAACHRSTRGARRDDRRRWPCPRCRRGVPGCRRQPGLRRGARKASAVA